MFIFEVLVNVGRDMSRRVIRQTFRSHIRNRLLPTGRRRQKCRPCLVLLMILVANTVSADMLKIDGSTGVKPLVKALAAGFQQQSSAAEIQLGSGLKPKARISALLGHDIDIAMASHGIDVHQITKQGLQVHHFAKMAVVMAVNHDVNITHISHQQLCDIYLGKLKNWQDLGMTDLAITPFIRPFTEVDAEVFRNQISCFGRLTIPMEIKLMNKSGAMARAIANSSGAIGMTTMVRVAQSAGKMKAIAINKVSPDVENMQSGAYPFARDSFLITHENPAESVMQFLAYIKSEQGAAVIIANNAVPVF